MALVRVWCPPAPGGRLPSTLNITCNFQDCIIRCTEIFDHPIFINLHLLVYCKIAKKNICGAEMEHTLLHFDICLQENVLHDIMKNCRPEGR
jgi:hypothetical protein